VITWSSKVHYVATTPGDRLSDRPTLDSVHITTYNVKQFACVDNVCSSEDKLRLLTGYATGTAVQNVEYVTLRTALVLSVGSAYIKPVAESSASKSD
jgi:hypothetical protein